MNKVQRLSLMGVGSSEPKRLAPEQVKAEGDDIVWPVWKHAAVSYVFIGNGYELTTRAEHCGGEYAQYFKRIMQDFVAQSKKRIVFTAHTMDVLSETEQVYKTYVKLKGSLMNYGVEANFTTVIATKRLPLTKLEAYKNDLLIVTDREKRLGFKHVFQTELTKETVNERIRSPLNMWADDETYIDNDMQLVFDRLDKFYNGN